MLPSVIGGPGGCLGLLVKRVLVQAKPLGPHIMPQVEGSRQRCSF